MTVDELIAKQQELNAPPPPEPTRFQRLLEAAKNAPLRWEDLTVTLGGEELEVAIARTSGRDWLNLESTNPPKAPGDIELGYNRQGLAQAYPLDRIKLAGEHPTPEQWPTLYDLLDAEDMKNINAVIWWVNVGKYQAEHARLKQNDKVREYQAAHAPLSANLH